MNVTIRRANKGDVESLARLYVEFHNFHAVGVPSRLRVVEPNEALGRAISDILDDQKAAIFVACLEGKVVGFVEIYLRETQDDPAVVTRRYAHLQSLVVTANLRKQGMGVRLVETAHEWVLSKGATEVELDSWEFPSGPLGFYESLGYETLKRKLVLKLPKREPTIG